MQARGRERKQCTCKRNGLFSPYVGDCDCNEIMCSYYAFVLRMGFFLIANPNGQRVLMIATITNAVESMS